MIDLVKKCYLRGLLMAVLSIGVINTAFAGSFEDFVYAIETDNAGKVKDLLFKGFDPNATLKNGDSALYSAIAQEKYAVAKALLAHPDIDVFALNPKKESILMIAALRGRVELVKTLLARGAEVNHPGWTPLHYAATFGHLEIVKLLLEKHAYIDADSPNNTTPLMMAARGRYKDLCEFLLNEGADPTIVNKKGYSAARFAKEAGDKELATYLTEKANAYKQMRAKEKPVEPKVENLYEVKTQPISKDKPISSAPLK